MPDQRGRPSGNSFWQVSTDNLRQSDRFEYWRSHFSCMNLELAGETRTGDFSGRALLCADAGGATFGCSATTGTVAGYTRPDSDFILIGATLKGAARIRCGHGPAREVTCESGIGIYDASQPLRTLAHDHTHVYVSLPRAVVIEELDGEVGFLSERSLRVPQTGLSRTLHAHLQMMAQDAAHLDGSAARMAMHVAVDLALGILSSEQVERRGAERRDHADELYGLAVEFIHRHYADPSLVVATIAYRLGCSRAHLYRVFALRGQRPGDAIRSVRVGRALSLLKARPGIPLARIAVLCGYESLSGLTRAFARETGTTPARLRAGQAS